MGLLPISGWVCVSWIFLFRDTHAQLNMNITQNKYFVIYLLNYCVSHDLFFLLHETHAPPRARAMYITKYFQLL